jgi:hypothetical protein
MAISTRAPLRGSDRSLTNQVFAKVFNHTGGCLGVGCQKHVRRIQPIHFATGLCRNDFVHVLLAHQAIRTPMQAKHRTFDFGNLPRLSTRSIS